MNKFILNIKKVFSKLITGDFLLSPLFYIGLTLLTIFLIQKTCHPKVPVGTSTGIGKMVSIKTVTDKDGTQHAVIPTNVVSKQIMNYRMDSLSKALKAKINAAATIASRTDTIFKERIIHDSVGNFTIRHKDDYIDLSATGNLNSDAANLHVALNDTLTYVDYTKKRILRANLRQITILNRNPYVKVISGAAIALKEPKTLFTIGPNIGYSAYIANGQVKTGLTVGIGLQFNLIGIKSK